MSYNPVAASTAPISSARAPLWIVQFRIEFAFHQHLDNSGLPDNDQYDVIYGRSVVRVGITPHNIPPLLSCHQSEADNVWSVEAERLQGEVLHLVLEDHDSAAV